MLWKEKLYFHQFSYWHVLKYSNKHLGSIQQCQEERTYIFKKKYAPLFCNLACLAQ